MRWLDYGCGAGLLCLAALKVMGRSFGSEVLPVLAAVAELMLGCSYLLRRTPRVSALGLTLLGTAFCLWTLQRGPELEVAKGCGCYGPYRLDFVPHLALASLILVTGGIQLLLLPRHQRPVSVQAG